MLQMYIVLENFNKKKHCGKITSLIVSMFFLKWMLACILIQPIIWFQFSFWQHMFKNINMPSVQTRF